MIKWKPLTPRGKPTRRQAEKNAEATRVAFRKIMARALRRRTKGS